MAHALENPLEAIPHSGQVRERLAENIREGRILRKLLKLAEEADREREDRRTTAGENS
jgi:hypothetical protein